MITDGMAAPTRMQGAIGNTSSGVYPWGEICAGAPITSASGELVS
jgi:hypothetical protein